MPTSEIAEKTGQLPITLRSLAESYLAIQHAIMSGSSDEDNGLDAALDTIEDAIIVKAENITKLVLELRSTTDGISSEINRLTRFKRALQAGENRLCSYLESELIACNLQGYEFASFGAQAKIKDTPSVVIEDQSLIPQAFWRRPPPPPAEVNKSAILDLYRKSGDTVPGTTIKERRLVIQ